METLTQPGTVRGTPALDVILLCHARPKSWHLPSCQPLKKRFTWNGLSSRLTKLVSREHGVSHGCLLSLWHQPQFRCHDLLALIKWLSFAPKRSVDVILSSSHTHGTVLNRSFWLEPLYLAWNRRSYHNNGKNTMETAKNYYNKQYENWMPWVEDKYLAWFGKNKTSYVAEGRRLPF